MSTVKQISKSLKWETFITHRGSLSRDAPAGKEHLKWVPNTVTLISGEKDAVLVDVFLTIDTSKQLVDWVAASGKSLTTIYITHAHGDHFFGLQPVLDRFPQARVIARPEVVEAMRQHISPESIEGFWNKLFPGQIAERLHVAEALDGDGFELEGHSLIAVGVGHTDTDNTTCLHIPSIDLVVAGDAVYNGVHLYLGETDATDPLVSPIFADLTGLPPLLIQAGSHEVLLDDATGLAVKAAADDVAVILDITSGVPHVFQAFAALLEEGGQFLFQGRNGQDSCQCRAAGARLA